MNLIYLSKTFLVLNKAKLNFNNKLKKNSNKNNKLHKIHNKCLYLIII